MNVKLNHKHKFKSKLLPKDLKQQKNGCEYEKLRKKTYRIWFGKTREENREFASRYILMSNVRK